jgi:DNA polymerase
MALHEFALEEFGLAPLWVRRGMGQAQAQAQAVEAVDTSAEATGASGATSPDVALRADDAGEAGAVARGGVAQRGAAGRVVATGVAHSGVERVRPEGSAQGNREQDEQRLAMRGDEAPRTDTLRKSSAQTTPAVTTASSTPASTSTPAKDDDFAWFDDLPTHPPGEAPHALVARAESSVQTLDWDALSKRVAACENCRLCEKRTNTVFGVGDRNADWMLIGEAPGENEDRQGEPFVGQAGKLLDNMLRSLTLARDTNVYIANVIKCRPPGNRNPEPDEVARCEPYLQRQVALVKPKLIIAMGRFAAQSLLKTDASISSLRGRVHAYEGVPVIVTYHPAYLLRSLPDKAKAWTDLCLARDIWLKAAGAPAS